MIMLMVASLTITKMMHYHTFQIKTYFLTLVGDNKGIAQLLVHHSEEEISLDEEWQEEVTLFKDGQQQLEEYFEGQRQTFDLLLHPSGSEYHKKVWQALLDIPYGALYTYKEVATSIGNPNASRAVGMANNRNPIPIIIPCHRVVGSNGKMMGYAYGIAMKRELIELESYHSFFKV